MSTDPQPPLGSPEHFRALGSRARTDRLPLSGTMDLTYRCNLRCIQCYVGHLVTRPASDAGELETVQILHLLSEAAAAGCLWLLFSGGEPLLRPDFLEIYQDAKKLGFLVTVFTNGTLVTQRHVDVFRDYPPKLVEVSLYGARQETYERVTGVRGSHARAMRGIEMLAAAGVRVGLKSVALEENAGEIEEIRGVAAALGLPFRIDPLITPRLDGAAEPVSHRVDACRAVALELSGEAELQRARRSWQALTMRRTGRPSPGSPPRCGAGLTSFHIDAQGMMRGCLLSRSGGHDVVRLGFAAAWGAIGREANDYLLSLTACADCPDILLCGYCPALFELEGLLPTGSEYACQLGRHRREALTRAMEVESV